MGMAETLATIHEMMVIQCLEMAVIQSVSLSLDGLVEEVRLQLRTHVLKYEVMGIEQMLLVMMGIQ